MRRASQFDKMSPPTRSFGMDAYVESSTRYTLHVARSTSGTRQGGVTVASTASPFGERRSLNASHQQHYWSAEYSHVL